MRGPGLLKVEGRIVTEVRNWVGTEGAAAAKWKAVSALLRPLRTDPTSGRSGAQTDPKSPTVRSQRITARRWMTEPRMYCT
jgi:hypothetical protein